MTSRPRQLWVPGVGYKDAETLNAADHRGRAKWYDDLDKAPGRRPDRETVEQDAAVAEQEVAELEQALEESNDDE
jgi:hypothetical protein